MAFRKFTRFMDKRFPGYVVTTDEGFPERPWQAIPKDQRLRLVEHLEECHDAERTLLRCGALQVQLLTEQSEADARRAMAFSRDVYERLGQDDFDQTEYGLLAINWNRPDTAIKEGFSEWLLEQRADREGRGIVDAKSQARSARLGDRLNWLGALRFKRYYRKKTLVDYDDTRVKVLPSPYAHYPDLCQTAARACELLSSLLKMGRT